MTKRITLIFSLCLFFWGLNAQSSKYIEEFENSLLRGKGSKSFEKSDFDDIRISDKYSDLNTGITHIYLQQYYKGVPIYNASSSIHIKSNKIVSKSNAFVSGLSARIHNSRAAISAEKAIQYVARDLNIVNPIINSTFTRNENGSYIFNEVSFADSPVKVSSYYMLNKENKLILIWNVDTKLKQSADFFSTRVNAKNGLILDQSNYTIYCNFDKPSVLSYDNPRHQEENHNHFRGDSSFYRVYPLPAESPLEAAHTLIMSPHDDIASPLGWHDTDGMEGAESTITRGNNVNAYLDKNDDNISDGDEPDGGESLVFDYPHDANIHTIDNDLAAQVNLFYMNNMMHDLTYGLGFNEVGGNFQNNTYGNGGLGGDGVEAQASDGSGTDNANFSTPADGSPGRMQMFLWSNTGGLLSIDSPQEIAGLVTNVGTGDFGPPVSTVNITGEVAMVDDGTFNGLLGCNTFVNADEINGKIALIERGSCFFSEKSEKAEDAGAIAVIICNIAGAGGDGEEIINMTAAADSKTINIPVLLIQKSVCASIKASLSANIAVTVTFNEKEAVGPVQFDAAFDNGVIAHEYGHGISNRLVGGPSNAGALNNDEQMGEGWSDFWTIAFSTKVGDVGSDPKGIGQYVSGGGRGIRRFPYTTDMTINPLTFDDIKGTTAPHPLGTVWNSMLYDMYWAFIDLYGFNPDWTDTSSGNYIAAQLVVEGMKLTAISPGFTNARDGIINADYIINDGNHNCLLWEIFARRGLGYFATQGDSDNRNDGVENFDVLPTCIKTMKINGDATPVVKENEDIDLSLTYTNHIDETQTGVILSQRIPEGLIYVDGSSDVDVTNENGVLSFNIGELTYETTSDINFKYQLDGSKKTKSLLYDGVEGNNELWEEIFIEGTEIFSESDIAHEGEYSWYITDMEANIDQALDFGPFDITGEEPVLKFWHSYKTEDVKDGGFVQITTNNGESWDFLDTKFIRNGYNSIIDYSTFAIPSLGGFTGNSNGFIDSYIDLSDYKGESVKIRFRFGTSDENSEGSIDAGWYIDDLELLDVIKFNYVSCIVSDQSEEMCTNEYQTFLDTDVHANSVTNTIGSINGFSVFPNPTKEHTSITFDAKTTSHSVISIYTIEGKLIKQQTQAINIGSNNIPISLKGINSGQYLMVLQNNEGQINEKLTIID